MRKEPGMRNAFYVFALVGWVGGCAQNSPESSPYARSPGNLTPTSDQPGSRMYPGLYQPEETRLPPPPPPPAVSGTDIEVARAVRDMIHSDTEFTPSSNTVIATVDRGVVTLTGTVYSEHERWELVDRVSKLPGVDHVRDHLKVDLR